jgi:hypothetical protein
MDRNSLTHTFSVCGFKWIMISSFGKYLMEPSAYDEILLCKILYFITDTELMAE